LDHGDTRWELPVATIAGVFRCLVAWRVVPSPPDAGVPEDVSQLLARALVSQALVTFPNGRGSQFTFIHTDQAEEARQAFDAEYFDWTQRGQAIFLSPLESSPPALPKRCIDIAFKPERFFELAELGVKGLTLPGVDGDVAGIYTFGASFRNELINALRRECERAEAGFLNVTEKELIHELGAVSS
jgi:hypothetical protein